MQRVLPEQQEQTETTDLREHQVLLGRQEPEVVLDHLVHQEVQDQQVRLDLLDLAELAVHQEVQDQQVLPEVQDQQVLREVQDPPDLAELRDLQVHPDQQDLPVVQDLLVLQVHQSLEDFQSYTLGQI